MKTPQKISFYRVEYLARQLNGHADINNAKDTTTTTNDNNNSKNIDNNDSSNSNTVMHQMRVESMEGVDWGLFKLVGGQEKVPCCTSHYHYILYAVHGRAYFTLGDGYKAPGNDALPSNGFIAELLRGNHFRLKNAEDALHASFLYYCFCAADPLGQSVAGSALPSTMLRDAVAQDCANEVTQQDGVS